MPPRKTDATKKPKARSKAAAKKPRSKVAASSEGISTAKKEKPALPPGEHRDPNTASRPPDYHPDYARQAKKLCELGATDYDLAQFFKVTTTTINAWTTRHKEFSGALKIGKGATDDRVERALYRRAVGYTFESEKVFNANGVVLRAPTVEHIPPDPGACKHWLANRRREDWAETAESKEVVIRFIQADADA